MSLMYSVLTYVGNSVLNYNLDYSSLLYLGYCKPGICYKTLVKFCTEICWVFCNTKSLTHQGRSRWFVPADSKAGPVIFHTKFRIYTSALLNEISNK